MNTKGLQPTFFISVKEKDEESKVRQYSQATICLGFFKGRGGGKIALDKIK